MFQKIWVPIGAYALLGLITAGLAWLLRDWIPNSLAFSIGADSIDSILNILASSMLAVTTFSLSIMLSAFNTASSSATPRAFLLLKTDQTAQQVLASFIGAFIFSLVGIISLQIGIYGTGGRVILFGATILVLTLIIVNLVRWIGHLTDFGRLGDTVSRVEDATLTAIHSRLSQPWLGGRPMRTGPPDRSLPLYGKTAGHISFINMARLNDLAKEAEATIYLQTLPGAFVTLNQPVVHIAGGPMGEAFDTFVGHVRDCVELSMERSFDQDPRFGLITLSEIASRALSPAVNDPGTAIDVIRRLTRVLGEWSDTLEPDILYPHIFVQGLEATDLIRDSFMAIARDGAALYEVQIALQRCLLALTERQPGGFGPAAAEQSSRAVRQARETMSIEEDVDRLAAIRDEIEAMSRDWRARSLVGQM